MFTLTDYGKNIEIADERHNIYINKKDDLQRLIWQLTEIMESTAAFTEPAEDLLKGQI